MAHAIRVDLPKRDPREELRARLEQAPVEHAEAVLAGFEVLQGLHDRGVLELLRGMLGGGDKILELAVSAANTPEAIRGIRNVLIVTRLLGAIDPDALSRAAKAQESDPPGFWDIVRMLRSRRARRGLAVMSRALEALGTHACG